MADDGIWQEMVDLYQQPGMAEHCLLCQDRLGLSVTAMLSLILLAVDGRGAIRPSAAAEIAAESGRWQVDVLRPLRQARDALKARLRTDPVPGLAELRTGLLARELDAERIEQRLVLALADRPGARVPASDPLADASSALARYLLALPCSPDIESRQRLCAILSAALPDYDGLDIIRSFDLALRVG
ncbi:TIGR02444 family protein [Methylonatrum kenyense]|uniref:TIGR02444 family protein n=1 Tax=Methylonatrum kenyense TaxID=455253 RepID=UPI0020BF8F34|nr:TIGR02444 family protein [Methylonatrum kenyense]MCK8515181.1 TIGR02444 family protein [Methylonatrum kenyense]